LSLSIVYMRKETIRIFDKSLEVYDNLAV
jgi:hypothetical protein